MPNCAQSDHRQTTDVGDFPIDNESSIFSASNVYSGLLADSDLQSNVPDFQGETALSPLSGHVTDHFHEPSLLPPEIPAPSEGTLYYCLKSTIAPERQAALPLLRSSHASTDVYNNNTAGSGSELLTDETLTSHAENFACSHKNVSMDFALDHSSISQIDHAEHSAPSPVRQTCIADIHNEKFLTPLISTGLRDAGHGYRRRFRFFPSLIPTNNLSLYAQFESHPKFKSSRTIVSNTPHISLFIACQGYSTKERQAVNSRY